MVDTFNTAVLIEIWGLKIWRHSIHLDSLCPKGLILILRNRPKTGQMWHRRVKSWVRRLIRDRPVLCRQPTWQSPTALCLMDFKRHLHNHCVWSCNLSIQGTNLLQSGCFCKIPMQCWLGGSSKRFPPISLHFGLRYFPHCRSRDGFPDSSSRFPDLISGISRAAVGAFQPPRPVWPAAAALAKPHFTAGHWESHCALFKATLQHCIKYTELLLEFLSTPGYRLTCQLRWISTVVEKAAILPINAIEAYIAIYNIQYRVRNNRTISNALY